MPTTTYNIRLVGLASRSASRSVSPAEQPPAPGTSKPTRSAIVGDHLATGGAPDPRLPGGKIARVVVRIGEHRAYLFDRSGNLSGTYGVRTGRTATPTVAGVKIVVGKNGDPRSVARHLWPSSGGKAFGTRLLDLSDYNPLTGETFRGRHGGQELHGTYNNDSIGKNFSHGCVGLRNADIEAIYDAVGVGSLVRFDR